MEELSMRKLKILYAGSPEASAAVLEKLAENADGAGFEIAGVLTNPPSARGRHSEMIPTEVARAAEKLGLPAFAFEHLREESRAAVWPLGADILVSFDYGRIFGPKFLSLFPLGGINLHPSALPKYRGCAPVPAAILNGDRTLGICVQTLALKTDEGDILASREIELDGTETTGSLMDSGGKVVGVGAELLTDVLCSIVRSAENPAEERPKFSLPEGKIQLGEPSYTGFLKKEDGIIDWSETAEEIGRKVRAYNPWPLASTESGGVRLLIIGAKAAGGTTSELPGTVLPYRKSAGVEIACGNGTVLSATELQWEKKKAMDYRSFMNGARNFVGSVLGKGGE